jgi:hypothetical protein
MKTNLDLARLLVRKAGSDLADVHRTLASKGPYDTGLFHCHRPFRLSGFQAIFVDSLI